VKVWKSSFSTGLLAILAAAFLISGPTVFASPIGWWKFDEGNGTTAYDSAGSHNGTITGAAWTTEGKSSSALHFDASGDYVRISGLEPGYQWTFAAWVKSDVNISFLNPPRNNILLYSSQCRIDLGINDMVHQGNLSFAIPLCGTLYSNKNSWKANEWYHITCTWAGPTKAIYVNGVLDNSEDHLYINSGVWIITYIGGKSTESSGSFDGVIDDVRIYNRALSAGEIEELYHKAFAPHPADKATNVNPNVVLSWSLGENAASHDVYFGTDFNDVNNANTSSPEYMGNFDVNSFDPGGLEYWTTYYWRIDEVNSPDVWKGDVWSFKTIGPVIGLSTTQFEFYAHEDGENPADQILGIYNSGAGTLNWKINEDCSWLSVEPNSGSSTGETDNVNLSVNTSGLAIGSYSCNLTISDGSAANSPQTVGVNLYIGDADGQLHVPSEYPTIQAAIDIALDGDIVIVAPDTYTGSGNRDLDFKGKAITVRSADPNDPNIVAATIIDCQNLGRGFYFYSGENAGSVLNGFTITNGYSTYGGGIYCNDSSPAITNCTFSGNSADVEGGGMSNSNSSPTITSCTFTGNSVSYDHPNSGGGMYNASSNPTIINCIFSSNSSYLGGGIWNTSSNPTITNCTFSGNSAESGGGIYNYNSSRPTITNCTFSGNSVSYGGGGVTNYNNSNPTITNCIIAGNSASGDGGGMFNGESSNPTVTNCTFSGNSASTGGGMSNGFGNPTVTNCTFSDNSASTGGGMCNDYFSNPTLANCILWGNTAPDGSQIYNTGASSRVVTFSDVQGGYPGIGNIDADPCFVDADANDYHLKSQGWRWDTKRSRWTYDDVTSRCIDAGNPGSPLGDELLSIPDDPDNIWGQNLRIDMGAFGGTAEASIPPYDWVLLSDLTNDGLVDLKDYAFQAADWLISADQQPGDLDRDSLVDISDLTLFVEDWLGQTTWY
jgi:parallel beta-helix repeat protein